VFLAQHLTATPVLGNPRGFVIDLCIVILKADLVAQICLVGVPVVATFGYVSGYVVMFSRSIGNFLFQLKKMKRK
jgi:hypothetical protein